MIYARRNSLLKFVKVNKAGAVSLMSVVRGLGLADDVVFELGIGEDKSITFIPTDLKDVPTTGVD